MSSSKKTFEEWWFFAGGQIHSLWKRKKYSKILDLAKSLPKEAWDEATRVEKETNLKEIQRLRHVMSRVSLNTIHSVDFYDSDGDPVCKESCPSCLLVEILKEKFANENFYLPPGSD